MSTQASNEKIEGVGCGVPLPKNTPAKELSNIYIISTYETIQRNHNEPSQIKHQVVCQYTRNVQVKVE